MARKPLADIYTKAFSESIMHPELIVQEGLFNNLSNTGGAVRRGAIHGAQSGATVGALTYGYARSLPGAASGAAKGSRIGSTLGSAFGTVGKIAGGAIGGAIGGLAGGTPGALKGAGEGIIKGGLSGAKTGAVASGIGRAVGGETGEKIGHGVTELKTLGIGPKAAIANTASLAKTGGTSALMGYSVANKAKALSKFGQASKTAGKILGKVGHAAGTGLAVGAGYSQGGDMIKSDKDHDAMKVARAGIGKQKRGPGSGWNAQHTQT